VATVVWAVFETKKRSFDRIRVQRIDVVEPDGTLRLAISDRARFPGTPIHGKEYARPDRTEAAGLLFMNDEGTEMGGLIWGGSRAKNGEAQSHGHLSFDQYDQNQIFSVDAGREGSSKFSNIVISQRGDWPMTDAIEAEKQFARLPGREQTRAWKHFADTHPGYADRIYLGRQPDGAAALRLKDPDGRDRLVILVGNDGLAHVQFLGPDGKVQRDIAALR
jgi:hypothetical protein